MNKQSKSSPSSVDLDSWAEHPLSDWLSSNKQMILWGIAALLAILVISYRVLSYQTAHAEADYFKAQSLFKDFQQSSVLGENAAKDRENLESLESLMKSYPDLRVKYEGPLAQTLLIDNQLEKSRVFANSVFKRTQDDAISPYHQFSITSYAIQEGNYEAALAQSKELKAQLNPEILGDEEKTLYFFNEVRMGVLSRQLGLKEEEQVIWSDLKKQINNYPQLKTLLALFKNGEAQFENYFDRVSD